MNAQLKDAPIRPDVDRHIFVGPGCVVVTRAWFDANEAQHAHLVDATMTAERARMLADRDVADARERISALEQQLAATLSDAQHWRAEADRLTAEMNTPETQNFLAGVLREAAHQRQRWGHDHDDCKGPEDWFWLIGALAGKSLRYHAIATALREAADVLPEGSGERAFIGNEARKAGEKSIHHIVTTAAAIANWHLNATGRDYRMRAGRPLPVAFQDDEEPEAFGVKIPPVVGVTRRGNIESAGL